MKMRELFVEYTDGTSEVARVERDDLAGRDALDRAAFNYIRRDDVASVACYEATRTAGREKGTYR